MRQIKFSYLFQNLETGIIHEKIWTLGELESGSATIYIAINLKKYTIIARRQYSGINDRHGHEIYEGDILQIETANHIIINVVCEFGIARRKMLGNCEVDIPSFYLRRDDLLSFPITNNWNNKHDLEMIEIVGNIYEPSFKSKL